MISTQLNSSKMRSLCKQAIKIGLLKLNLKSDKKVRRGTTLYCQSTYSNEATFSKFCKAKPSFCFASFTTQFIGFTKQKTSALAAGKAGQVHMFFNRVDFGIFLEKSGVKWDQGSSLTKKHRKGSSLTKKHRIGVNKNQTALRAPGQRSIGDRGRFAKTTANSSSKIAQTEIDYANTLHWFARFSIEDQLLCQVLVYNAYRPPMRCSVRRRLGADRPKPRTQTLTRALTRARTNRNPRSNFRVTSKVTRTRALLEFTKRELPELRGAEREFKVLMPRVGGLQAKLKKRGPFFTIKKVNVVDFSLFPPKDTTYWNLVNDKKYKAIRPLLNLSRGSLTTLSRDLRLPIYPDKSNKAVQYSRNRLREQILPAIKLFLNPQIEDALFKLSELLTRHLFLVSHLVNTGRLTKTVIRA